MCNVYAVYVLLQESVPVDVRIRNKCQELVQIRYGHKKFTLSRMQNFIQFGVVPFRIGFYVPGFVLICCMKHSGSLYSVAHWQGEQVYIDYCQQNH